MNQDEKEDTTIYRVVANHEEQYSIWPVRKEIPLGWRDMGKQGMKAEVLGYIKEVWTDMRPLALRIRMDKDKADRDRAEKDKADKADTNQP